MNNEILGPFEKEKLFELPGFEASSLICPQTPVGEKTEDWKEASTYPEVALMFNPPATSTPGAPGIQAPVKEQTPSPIPAADSPLKAEQAGVTPPPALGPAGPDKVGQAGGWVTGGTETPEEIKFKPIAASSLEPAAPPPSPENIGIEVNRFGALKGDGKIEHPVTELARSAAAGFDSLSISQVRKKIFSISVPAVGNQDQERKTSAEPPLFQPPESTNFSAAGQPTPQPEISGNPASPAALDTAALEILSSKMQTLCETALTRQELNSQLEPLRQKLERLGEALASTDAVQFQRDLLVKLGYLENAVSEIKSSLSAAAGEKTATVWGSLKPGMIAEAPKKENKQADIVDSGRKSIRFGLFFKKASKFLVTLILIAAVALVAVFGLKQFMGFDATRFIPFPIPFLAGNKAAPASEAQSPEASAKPSASEQPAAPEKAEPIAPDIPPEVIYFIHTYALRPGALTLENTIRREAAKAGWDSDKLNWENCAQSGSTPEAGKFQAAPGAYAIAAVIPSKDGKNRLSFSYEVDTKLATVKPLDEIGKTAMETLISASTLKTQPKPRTLRQARRAGSRTAPEARVRLRRTESQRVTKAPAKEQTRQTAPRTQTPPSDEYEYVDEEEQ